VWDADTGTVLDDSNREVMRVTAVDTGTNTLTVTRAQEGTSDVFHPDTSRVANRPTAKMFDDVDVSLEEVADYTASPTEVTAPVNTSAVTADQESVRDGDGYWNARYDLIYNSRADIAAAVNQLITDSQTATQGRQSPIKIPYPRSGDSTGQVNGWNVSSGQISIPYFENDKSRVQIAGPSRGPMTTRLAVQSGFPDSVLIQKDKAGASVGGTNKDEGDAIVGLDVFDAADVLTKIVEINEETQWVIEGCRFQSGTNMTYMVDVQATNNNFAGFGTIQDVHFNINDADVTAIRLGTSGDSTANSTYLHDVTLSGTAQGTLLDTENAEDVVVVGGDAEKGDPAFLIQSGGFQMYGTRFEGDYGTSDNVTTPVEIADGVEGYYLQPSVKSYENARSWLKQSTIRGFGAIILDIITPYAPFYSEIGQIPDEHATVVDGNIGVTGKDINFSTNATTGATVGVTERDLAGDKNLWRIDASISPGETDGNLIRFGWSGAGNQSHYLLAADPTEELSTHGITTNWVAHTNDGGTITATDTGTSLGTGSFILTAIVEDDDTADPPSSHAVRYLIDGVEVARHSGLSGLGGGGPRLSVESRDGTSKNMLVWALNPRILGRFGQRLP